MTAHRDRPARPGSDRDLGRGEHRMRKRLLIVFVVTLPLVIAMIAALAASAAPPAATTVTPGWVTDLAGGSGSTVGPDGALYVPEPASGEISRVDPETGAVTTFASCLPTRVIPLGGAMDVAFIGNTAYALVTPSPSPHTCASTAPPAASVRERGRGIRPRPEQGQDSRTSEAHRSR